MNTKVQTPIMPTLFAGLYLLVHFIPELDAADVMGPQWLYTGIIDALGILFIFMHRQHFAPAIQGIFKLNPTNYTHAENVGICLYTAQKYQDAIIYFNKSIAVGTSTTGKSEYYLGLSYLSTGKKIEACNALQLANNKKYPDAAAAIKYNCQ